MKFSYYSKKILFPILLVSLLAVSIHTYGQVSGYLGKRILVGFEVPCIVKLNLMSPIDYTYGYYNENHNFVNTNEYAKVNFLYRPTFKVEYVFTRKSTVQMFVRIFNPKVDIPIFTRDSNSQTLSYTPKSRVKMNTINIGVKYKLYFGDAVSPIGFYNSFGLEYSRMKFDVDTNTFSTDNYQYWNQGSNYAIPEPTTTSNFIASYCFGKQSTLGDHLLMNIGFELAIPIRLKKSEETVAEEDWAKTAGSIQTWKHSFVNVTLGFSLPL